jgi:hypothetical protein
LKLRGGGQRGAAAAAVDPAKLPHEQQLPQIIELLHSKHVVSTAACMHACDWHLNMNFLFSEPDWRSNNDSQQQCHGPCASS